MDGDYVLVIGSAGMDVKGCPDEPLLWETSNVGRVRQSVGGVARNIAENLARLEVPVILLSAVGDDRSGVRVIEQCEANGVNCAHVRRLPSTRTGRILACQLMPATSRLLSELAPMVPATWVPCQLLGWAGWVPHSLAAIQSPGSEGSLSRPPPSLATNASEMKS